MTAMYGRALTVSVAICFASFANADKAVPPNFVILVTDDQRLDTIGIYNPHNPIETPNLDRLGRSGVIFLNGFVTTPICAASRASILSGRYVSSARSHRFLTPMDDDVFDTIYPVILREHGYFAGQLGKYGVGITRSQRQAFDFFDATASQGPPFREYKGEQVHDSEWLTLRTGDFLDAVPEGKPFVLQVNYKAPHPSSEPAPEDKGKLAQVMFERVPLDNPEANMKLPEFVRTGYGRRIYQVEFNSRIGDHQPYMREYFEKIMGVERSVGRILNMLEERGVADNTVIIFISDHGTHFGERQLAGKWTPYDDSLRVPFLIYDPRPGSAHRIRRDELVLNIDIAPTLLDLAGVEIPPQMDGNSMLALIKGHDVAWRDRFYFEHYTSPAPVLYIPRSEGVRTQNSKYFRWLDWKLDTLSEEFYDLAKDPGEARNVMEEKELAVQIENAKADFKAWRSSNPHNFEYFPYSRRPQFGASEIDWEKFQKVRPKEFARIKREVERLGVTWDQAMNDWSVRYKICSEAGYWY
jgi:arylsulfatase A-like enzyme